MAWGKVGENTYRPGNNALSRRVESEGDATHLARLQVEKPIVSAYQAQRCRRLASQLTDYSAAEHLLALAAEYEAEAIEHSSGQQMEAGDGPGDDGQQNQQQG